MVWFKCKIEYSEHINISIHKTTPTPSLREKRGSESESDAKMVSVFTTDDVSTFISSSNWCTWLIFWVTVVSTHWELIKLQVCSIIRKIFIIIFNTLFSVDDRIIILDLRLIQFFQKGNICREFSKSFSSYHHRQLTRLVLI